MHILLPSSYGIPLLLFTVTLVNVNWQKGTWINPFYVTITSWKWHAFICFCIKVLSNAGSSQYDSINLIMLIVIVHNHHNDAGRLLLLASVMQMLINTVILGVSPYGASRPYSDGGTYSRLYLTINCRPYNNAYNYTVVFLRVNV